MSEQTYWNGEPCDARRVLVIVGNTGRFSTPWFIDYVGQERHAVEVTYGRETFYLDDEGGHGWRKVTEGRGSPRWSHGSLEVERIVQVHHGSPLQGQEGSA